jgi:hypothetical protein
LYSHRNGGCESDRSELFSRTRTGRRSPRRIGRPNACPVSSLPPVLNERTNEPRQREYATHDMGRDHAPISTTALANTGGFPADVGRPRRVRNYARARPNPKRPGRLCSGGHTRPTPTPACVRASSGSELFSRVLRARELATPRLVL